MLYTKLLKVNVVYYESYFYIYIQSFKYEIEMLKQQAILTGKYPSKLYLLVGVISGIR